jgi:hypothetical protein
MSRNRTRVAALTDGTAAMKNWRYVALHTIAATAFIFVLQRFALNASLESSLLWALVFGGCAAGIATMQSNR